MARSGLQAAVAGAVSAAYLSLSISSPGFAQGAPDLNTLTTQQAAADVCGGKLTSKALVKAALDRAKAKPELNAFIMLDEAGAMKAATPAEKRAPASRSAAFRSSSRTTSKWRARPPPPTARRLRDSWPTKTRPPPNSQERAGAKILAKTRKHKIRVAIPRQIPPFQTGDD